MFAAMGRLGSVMLVVVGAGLAGCLAVAAFVPDPDGTALLVSRVCFATVLATAAVACAARSPMVGEDRPTWLAVAAGLVLWLAGNLVYWQGSDATPEAYGDPTDLLYLGYYLAILVGLHLLANEGRLRSRASLGTLVGLLGMASLWAWLATSGSVLGSGDGEAQAFAYPVLDLVLVAATGLLILSRGRAGDRSLKALIVGLALIGIADAVYALEVNGDGPEVSEAALNTAWATGLVAVGLAPWLRRADLQPGLDDGPSLRLALGAAAVALLILTWDHFERVSDLALVLATLTILASMLQVALLYRDRVRTELELKAAGVRSARALALTVDAKDRATHSHSDRVAQIAMVLARDFGFNAETCDRLVLAGRLHDIGKISIPEAVLIKPGPLTDVEYELMKSHAAEGARITAAAGLDDIAGWIMHHHEHWDGGGYPAGLTEEAIPLESRILGAADALDAMISNRPYRRGMPLAEAMAELHACAGGQFDPTVVRAITELLGRDEVDLGDRRLGQDELEREIEVELNRPSTLPGARV
jgi:HD-GYP domain-containing protein (c-di-GMP phosphodiesterase class II)